MFFSYFFTFRIHEAWTSETTSKKKAIFEKYVDVLCVYVIYIYMMMNVVHNCAVVRSFVLLLLS